MKLKSSNREHRLVTQGEALFSLIRKSLFRSYGQIENHPWLEKWSLVNEWSDFIEQATCLFILGRLLRVARHKDLQHSDKKLSERELFSFVNNEFEIDRTELREWVRLTVLAAEVSSKDCSPAIAKSIRNWASTSHQSCYLCDINLDFTVGSQADNAYTLEHVWPRSYGGDSSEQENLLPACKQCNSARKKDLALWSATAVHSVNLKVLASDNARDKIEGPIKYSIHQRHLLKFAVENRVTLKAAALKVGPWRQIPDLIDRDDSGHFFNLRNYRA